MLHYLAALLLNNPMDASLKTVSYVIPVLIAIFTIPVIWRFAKNIRSTKTIKEDEIYQDEDGKATEESMAKYSTKRSFILIFLGTALGVASSFALAVIATIESMNIKNSTIIWLLFWSWVCNSYFLLDLILTKYRSSHFCKSWIFSAKAGSSRGSKEAYAPPSLFF